MREMITFDYARAIFKNSRDKIIICVFTEYKRDYENNTKNNIYENSKILKNSKN